MPTPSIQESSHMHPERYVTLDGWRATSILCVLAAHMIPIGPKYLRLNETAGPLGMALFFTLSGFLITQFLIRQPDIRVFLIRRLCRILPLAWLGLLCASLVAGASMSEWFRNATFTANIPPVALISPVSHFWSLCVEVQFYVVIAALVGLFGVRGLYALPFACFAVTFHRVIAAAPVDIVTWRRVDEILAGAIVAMVAQGMYGHRLKDSIGQKRCSMLLFAVVGAALVASSHPSLTAANYARPYLAAAMIAITLNGAPGKPGEWLLSRSAAYIASISYALYVIHHILLATPLGYDPERVLHYTKRVTLILLTFGMAHLSTKHFEARFIALGRRWTQTHKGP